MNTILIKIYMSYFRGIPPVLLILYKERYMKFSKRLFTKTVALAAICASVATASFAAPQGSFDTSEIHVTGQASRSVAPTYAILTLGITSENTNINAAKSIMIAS